MLEKDVEKFWSLTEVKPMIMMEEDKHDFEKARKCWICEKEFEGEKKVGDHCHFAGEVRGASYKNTICSSGNQIIFQ